MSLKIQFNFEDLNVIAVCKDVSSYDVTDLSLQFWNKEMTDIVSFPNVEMDEIEEIAIEMLCDMKYYSDIEIKQYE